MAPSTVAQRKDEIFKLLSDNSIKTVTLVGDPGVGKTWTARQISNCAVKEGLFDFALWVFLDGKFDDVAICDSTIARQLPFLSIVDEWEAEDGIDVADTDKTSQQKLTDFLKGKRFLLILDNGRNETDVKHALSKLKDWLNLHNPSSYKVIITSVKSFDSCAPMENEKVIQLEPLSAEESRALLRKRVGNRVYDDHIKDLSEAFIKKTKYLPGSIILMAKAIRYFSQRDSAPRMLKSALEQASDDKSYDILQLLHRGYDVLPRNVLIDCCRRGSHFFRDRGSIHYNELIAYWILEGYFGHVDCIEVAYEKGHSVLMELVDCQVLKNLEGGFVIMDRAILNLDEYDRYGFGGTACLGLADLFADGEWEGFGRITLTDGMIKSLCDGKKGRKLSTVFLSGNRCVEFLDNASVDSKQEIEVLVFFNPICNSLTHILSDMHKLFVLVLRGCVFLENIGRKFEFERLTVLEISDASSLKTIPDEFFDHILQLRSLLISELKVESLPSSMEKLKELRWLILRECSSFKELISLKNFKNLLVLDVSGATSLTNFKDKAFKYTPKLQTINLSRTSIVTLPKLLNLKELTHILLSGCESLDRIPKTDALSRLQTLDLSGAKGFKEFHEQSLGNPGDLNLLDLSDTPFENLPSKFNSRQLLLKRCSQLKKLTCVEAFEGLEVLDLSGTKSLVEIEAKYFSHPRSLQILNLSETSITTLPSLSNACAIRKLLLSGCTSLTAIVDESFEQMTSLEHLDLSGTMIQFLPRLSDPSVLSVLSLKDCTKLSTLPPLEHLSNLQELNLCGVVALEKTGTGFLEQMSQIQTLHLSETPIAELPSMSNLKRLEKLFLRGCKKLQTVKNLGELTTLEVLDLSETRVTQVPPLDNFRNLRRLLLGGCSSLEGFLAGETLRDLPYGISKLTNLEYIDFPNTKNIQGGDSRNTNSQQEVVDPKHWAIFRFPDETPEDSEKPFSGIQFLQSLKENPTLLDESLRHFHFCIHPTKAQTNNGHTHCYRNDLMFRDIRFQATEFGRFKEQRSLEIHGLNFFPTGIEDVLCKANCVFFINNTFKLSGINASCLKEMKGCWIERCAETESFLNAREEDDITRLGIKLEFLGVSNAINLRSMNSGKLPCWGFEKLQSLYLDCCPKLANVFSASQLPKNLKVLQIKFCDTLASIFTESQEPEPVLQNLETLYLWELPELKSIGCRLPSLQALKVWECPKLQKLDDIIRSVNNLQSLWVSNVFDLKSICSGSLQPGSVRNLEALVVESCPMLENVFPTPQAPQSLKTLKIKSCNQLKTVFEHGTPPDCILRELQTLHLYNLPKLEKIGCKLPAVDKPIIMGCPKLQRRPVA